MRSAALWCLWVVLRIIACVRPAMLVAPEGKPYLGRYYLTPKGAWWARLGMPRVFLHCFLSSDPDRGWHSHPWHWAHSLILRGQYLESRPNADCVDAGCPDLANSWRLFGPGDINTLGAEDFHRVKLLTPKVWTLFVVGPLHGHEWGFLNEQGIYRHHGTETPGD